MSYIRSYKGRTSTGSTATVTMSTPPIVGNLIVTGQATIGGTNHTTSDNATGGGNSYSQNVIVNNSTYIRTSIHHAVVVRTNAGGLTVTGGISGGSTNSGHTIFACEYDQNQASNNFVAGESATKTQTSSTAMMTTAGVTNSIPFAFQVACWGSNASTTVTNTAGSSLIKINEETAGATYITAAIATLDHLNTSASRTFGGQISAGTYQCLVGCYYRADLEMSHTLPANAALLAVMSRSVAANAALKAIKTRSVGESAVLLKKLTRDVPVNTALKRPVQKAVPANAGLLKKTVRTVAAQGALIWRPTRSLVAKAMLQVGATQMVRNIAANAALKRLTTRTVGAAAALKKKATRAVSAQAALIWRPTRSVAQSVVLRKLLTRTVSASASLVRAAIRTVGASAALLKYTTRAVPVNAALKRILVRSVTAQAALKALQTRSLEARAYLTKAEIRTIAMAAALLKKLSRNVPALAALLRQVQIDVPLFAHLFVQVSIAIPCWAYLRPTIGQVEVHTGVGEAERIRAQKILLLSRTSTGESTARAGTSRAARIITGIGRLTGRIRP